MTRHFHITWLYNIIVIFICKTFRRKSHLDFAFFKIALIPHTPLPAHNVRDPYHKVVPSSPEWIRLLGLWMSMEQVFVTLKTPFFKYFFDVLSRNKVTNPN